MSKYCIVDFRMRKVEKDFIKSMGYELIENGFDHNVYDEIAAHPDVYYTKVGQVIFCEPDKKIDGLSMVSGVTEVSGEYPEDVPYNVAIVGKRAVHNFEYTDSILKSYLEKSGYELINVKQGYSKCSTCVLDENTVITTDISIARELDGAGVEVLFVSEPDIKLKRRTNTSFMKQSQMSFEDSEMQGFIGGALVRLKDTVILFGDVNCLVNGRKIQKFILDKGLNFHHFEGLDVVDYGGVIEVENNG